MNISRLGLILLAAAGLAAGFFTGILTAKYHVRHLMRQEFRLPPPPFPDGRHRPKFERDRGPRQERMLDDISRGLKLTPEQRRQIKNVLDRHALEIEAAEEKFGQTLRNAMEQTDAEIVQYLDPAQKERFYSWKKRFRRD